jgi:peroxiredoxin
MKLTLSRRSFARRAVATLAVGAAAPDLAALDGFSKSAHAAIQLPDAASGWNETMPVPAPKFHFMDQEGRRLTLAHYQGTGLIVNFWATWCPPCRAELPTLLALNKSLHGTGIRVLLISVDSAGAQVVRPFFERHHITDIPMLIDPNSSALNAFDASGIPFTAVVNRDGLVAATLEGAGDWNTPTTIAALKHIMGPAKTKSKPKLTAT